MIVLPIGLPNRVETGPDGFSRKVVFGLRGFLAEIILASFSIECGKVYALKDTGKIVQMLSQLVVVYRKADPAALNAVSAAAFEILLEIRDQIHAARKGASDVIQLLHMNIHTPCSIGQGDCVSAWLSFAFTLRNRIPSTPRLFPARIPQAETLIIPT